jgi:methyltransferase-like protein
VDALRALRFGSLARPAEEVDLATVAVQKFVAPDGSSLSTDHPVSKAALHHLINIWPHTATFPELLSHARARVNSPNDPAAAQADAEGLASNLLKAFTFSERLIAFTLHEPDFTTEVSDRPRATDWARLQSKHTATITTLRHGRYALEPQEQFIIQRLDGHHTREMIVDALMAGPVAAGDLITQVDGQPVTDPSQMRDLLGQGLDHTLHAFARAPLLIA